MKKYNEGFYNANVFYLTAAEAKKYAEELGIEYRKSKVKEDLDEFIGDSKRKRLALIRYFRDKYAVTSMELESMWGITKKERKKMQDRGFVKPDSWVEWKIGGYYIEIPIFYREKIYTISKEQVDEWKEAIKPSAKQLESIEKAKKTRELNHIKKHTCTICNKHDENIRDFNGRVVCRDCYWKLYDEEKKRIKEEKYQRAINLKKDIIENPSKYIILDMETTGVDPMYGDKILEIAAITPTGEILCNTLINPEVRIESGAYSKHRISQDMVKDAPTLDKIWEKLKPHLINKKIIMYHADFLEGFLINETDLFDMEYEIINWEEVNTELNGNTYSYCQVSLTSALGRLAKHRALSDCMDLLELIKRECKVKKEKTEKIESIQDILDSSEMPF